MPMLETAETRWFFKNSAPALVRDWFTEGRDLSVEERTDNYLVFAGCESVGVKLRDIESGRESKFEVKAIRGAPEVLDLGGDVAGRTDSWVKWSYATSEFDHLPSVVNSETIWLPVQKRRVLRRFSLDKGSVLEAPVDDPATAGCNVDLVDLHTVDGAWWTLGFESFGPAVDLRSQLHAVAESWFDARHPPFPLRVTDSIAYANWVAALAQDNQQGATD